MTTTDGAASSHSPRRIPTTGLACLLTFANVTVAFGLLLTTLDQYMDDESTNYLAPQEIWGQFLAYLLLQAVINGLLLAAWRRVASRGVV